MSIISNQGTDKVQLASTLCFSSFLYSRRIRLRWKMFSNVVIACFLSFVTAIESLKIEHVLNLDNPCHWKSSYSYEKVIDTRENSLRNATTMQANYLPIPVLGAEFCNAMIRYGHNIVVKNPTFLSNVSIPTNCHINSLEVIQSAVKHVEFEQNNYLQRIILRKSDLVEIPPTINKLANLVLAVFQLSKLEWLDLSLFCPLANLQKIDLIRNNITTVTGISSDVVCNPSLLVILLNRNNIKELSLDLFASFQKLVLLSLASNKLESLQGNLANPDLEKLVLSYNQLTVLDMCKWSKPNQMLELQVSFNNLTEVPLCLEALGDVTYVDFRYNSIRQVEVHAFNKLRKLECINLTNNNITTFPLDESVYSPALKVLQVYDNPLDDINIPIGSFNRLKIFHERQPNKLG